MVCCGLRSSLSILRRVNGCGSDPETCHVTMGGGRSLVVWLSFEVSKQNSFQGDNVNTLADVIFECTISSSSAASNLQAGFPLLTVDGRYSIAVTRLRSGRAEHHLIIVDQISHALYSKQIQT